MEGNGFVLMGMLGRFWWQPAIMTSSVPTAQIVFQEDRGSVLLKYILGVVPLVWKCVFPALTTLLCLFFAVWMAKNHKKRKQS